MMKLGTMVLRADGLPHTKMEKIVMFLFIISLGFGEAVSIGPLKLSYITTVLAFLVFLRRRNWKLPLTVKNHDYSKLLVFLYVWIGYAILQFVLAKDIELYKSFFQILIINVVVMYLIINYVNTKQDWLFVLNSFMFLLFISLLVGFWEIKTGNHIAALTGELNLIYYRFLPISFYTNGNDSATVLVFGVYAVLFHMFAVKRRFVFLLFDLLILVATVYQIILINCRGATFSLPFMLIMIVVLFFATKASMKRKVNKSIINTVLVVVASMLLMLVFLRYSPSELIGRYSGAGNYGSDMGRFQMIVKGLNALLNSIGIGVGPGQSILINNINLHFFYLEILVDYGIWVGGYLLFLFFKMSFNVRDDLKNFSSIIMNSLFRSFPIVLILLGVASSGMIRIRATWIMFSINYLYAYNQFDFGEGVEN